METVESRRNELLTHSLGPVIRQALEDPEVFEISLNDDGRLWIERSGEPMRDSGTLSAADALRIVSLVGDSMDIKVCPERPIVEGEFPLCNARFEGLIPPVARMPVFSIRKHSARVIPLEDYVTSGIMPDPVRRAIREAIVTHGNILVIGGTGSGKTTLVNGIIAEMADLCPDDRLGIQEDTRELQSNNPNTLFLRTTVHVSHTLLTKAFMRLRPDRILVGEVRGAEALDLLMAWNTGHPGGVSTIHANSAEAGLIRLEQLVSMASLSPLPKLIGEAVDLLVFITKVRGTRQVTEAAWCRGYDPATQSYKLETIHAA